MNCYVIKFNEEYVYFIFTKDEPMIETFRNGEMDDCPVTLTEIQFDEDITVEKALANMRKRYGWSKV